MAIYLNNRQMLSQIGYQESDMYSSQQLSLESQTFLQTQYIPGAYLQQMTFVICNQLEGVIDPYTEYVI